MMAWLVLDTDVMVAAIDSSTGASRQLLLMGLREEIGLVVSTALMLEYESVLLHPDRLAKADASVGDVLAILDGLAGVARLAHVDFRWRPSGADEDDELVLEAGINGRADGIATFNLRHMRNAALRFGIRAERPGPLLRELRG